MSTTGEEITSKIKKLEAELRDLRENELPHLDERIFGVEKFIERERRFTGPLAKELHKGLIVILSLLSFMCVFSTVTGFFSLTLGSFLSIACIATLLLFVIVR